MAKKKRKGHWSDVLKPVLDSRTVHRLAQFRTVKQVWAEGSSRGILGACTLVDLVSIARGEDPCKLEPPMWKRTCGAPLRCDRCVAHLHRYYKCPTIAQLKRGAAKIAADLMMEAGRP